MKAEPFNKIVDEQMNKCSSMLVRKAKEYADDSDRLHNFKQAAHLEQTSPVRALAGMMSKHTVSIYDMINSDEPYPAELWDEKITDHINYLLLLRACLEENYIHPLNAGKADNA